MYISLRRPRRRIFLWRRLPLLQFPRAGGAALDSAVLGTNTYIYVCVCVHTYVYTYILIYAGPGGGCFGGADSISYCFCGQGCWH